MTDDTSTLPSTFPGLTAAPPDHPQYPALEIDYALYEKMLEGSEWTDAQKQEFIETLWGIVVQFVDMGIGIHPVQQATDDASGHGPGHVDIPAAVLEPASEAMVNSKETNSNTPKTSNHAAVPFASAAERKEI